jgi:hypothetical protein
LEPAGKRAVNMIKEASRVDLTHEQDAPTPKKAKYAALELEKMDITYAEEVGKHSLITRFMIIVEIVGGFGFQNFKVLWRETPRERKENWDIQQRLQEVESATSQISEPEHDQNTTVYTVPCLALGDTIYEYEWMMGLFEKHDFVAFKDMSKANGVNHHVFWQNLDDVPGNFLFVDLN